MCGNLQKQKFTYKWGLMLVLFFKIYFKRDARAFFLNVCKHVHSDMYSHIKKTIYGQTFTYFNFEIKNEKMWKIVKSQEKGGKRRSLIICVDMYL